MNRNEWQLMDEKADRNHILEVKKVYDLDCEVWRKIIDSNDYEIKIIANGKEVILHEHMSHGQTKFVVLTTDKSTNYKKYHEAEEDAIEYLKG